MEIKAPSSDGLMPSSNSGHRYFIFLIAYLGFLSAFGSFVNDMYIPTLPSMMHSFGCSISVVQLGLTLGMVGLGIGEVILGPLSDKYGRKPVLLFAMIIFISAAVISVFSPTIHFFIVCRLFQGLGASGGIFLARTIPADNYSGRQLARVMALVGAVNGVAPAFGPVIGGIVAKDVGWKGIFWILSALGGIVLVLMPFLKESLDPSRRLKGGIWQAFASYGILLKNKPFMIHVILKGAALGFLFAYISSAPFIIQEHYGMSELVFSFIFGANALAIVGGSMVALKFKPLKRAAIIGAIGMMVFSCVEAIMLWYVDNFWSYELLMLPILFSSGLIFTSGNTLAMNEGRADAGGASAVLGLAGYVFGGIVSPLVGIGNVMHSTAIAFVVMSAITLIYAFFTKRLIPDLDSAADSK